MQIFSPDGKYAYICSSFTPETVTSSTWRTMRSSATSHKRVRSVPTCAVYARRSAGLVHAQRRGQGASKAPRRAAVRDTEDARHRSDYESWRQFRAHAARPARLRDDRRTRLRARLRHTRRASRSQRSWSAACRTASGRPATARACTSVLRRPTSSSRSTPRSRRSSRAFRCGAGRASGRLRARRRAGRQMVAPTSATCSARPARWRRPDARRSWACARWQSDQPKVVGLAVRAGPAAGRSRPP